MKRRSEHNISVAKLLDFIPYEMIQRIAQEHKVDRYAKVLTGKNMFLLLLYGILENKALSQRSLEDTFNSPIFKTLFQLDENQSIRRSSISERLSSMKSDYFKQIYHFFYDKFSQTHSFHEFEKHNLIRVDSTIVTDISGKMQQGLKSSNQSTKNKQSIKFSVAFDGQFPCGVDVFNENQYSSEDLALPKAITNHVKQYKNEESIYVIDRGVSSAKTMDDFSKGNIKFVCRLKNKRKIKELESYITEKSEMDFDGLNLISDSRVHLYGERRTIYENDLRLIVVERIDDQELFTFATNDLTLSAKEIAAFYKKRWDIEVFFRFIKQELNASHLVSLNKNGIEIVIYMLLIAAILIVIYKKENDISYATAKRRFGMELQEIVIRLMIELSGGNPSLVFRE